jgi:hypothetical protein
MPDLSLRAPFAAPFRLRYGTDRGMERVISAREETMRILFVLALMLLPSSKDVFADEFKPHGNGYTIIGSCSGQEKLYCNNQ